MQRLSRRQAAQQLAGILIGAVVGTRHSGANASSAAVDGFCTLGFGTYGLPGVPVAEAVPLVSAAGYDSVEIAVMADRDAAPERLDAKARRALRRVLDDAGLQLASLMENLNPLGDAGRHRADVQRLRRAAELAHDLVPGEPPLVQSVLGGRDWDAERSLCRDRMADWLEVAQSTDTTICVKPHRSHAMSRPAEARWLIEQLGNPARLRMVYDYSHYALRDMTMAETVAVALPITAHVAVKDVRDDGGKVSFDLPGKAGTIDYAALMRLLYEGGYRGDVCVEVSAQIWRQPGYDPQAALETCYRHLARAFDEAEVPRRQARAG